MSEANGSGPEERYVVTSISGYRIGPEAHIQLASEGGQRWTTEWYVIDTVYCCNVVRTCRTEAVARKYCHLINRLENRHESEQRWLEKQR